jgi:hypothetical protein
MVIASGFSTRRINFSPCRRKSKKPAKEAGLVVAQSGLELLFQHA